MSEHAAIYPEPPPIRRVFTLDIGSLHMEAEVEIFGDGSGSTCHLLRIDDWVLNRAEAVEVLTFLRAAVERSHHVRDLDQYPLHGERGA